MLNKNNDILDEFFNYCYKNKIRTIDDAYKKSSEFRMQFGGELVYVRKDVANYKKDLITQDFFEKNMTMKDIAKKYRITYASVRFYLKPFQDMYYRQLKKLKDLKFNQYEFKF